MDEDVSPALRHQVQRKPEPINFDACQPRRSLSISGMSRKQGYRQVRHIGENMPAADCPLRAIYALVLCQKYIDRIQTPFIYIITHPIPYIALSTLPLI